MPPLGSQPHGGWSAPAGAPYPAPVVSPGPGAEGVASSPQWEDCAQLGFAPLPPPGRAGKTEAAAAARGRGGKRWSPNRRFGRLDGRVEALPCCIQLRCRFPRLAPGSGALPPYQRVM